MQTAYVYILTNRNHTVLYTGVTGNLAQRIRQHRNHTFDGFSARYNLTKLVFVEEYTYITQAIAREKQIKSWRRQRKIDQITASNPAWCELMEE